MATENYGIYGELIQSLAATPVSTATKIIFIGACASGDLNRAYEVSSFADYATRLGGAVGDGYNLTEAAIAAFNVVGLGGVVMIPVSHSTTFSAADYVGDGVSTGAAAIVRYLAANPTAVVLVCAPSITDATALAAVKAACKKADGHWDSVLVYDTDIPAGAVDANNVFVDADAVTKTISDEQAICCLGKCKTDGAAVISMAAVRCCLMARADAGYGVPARSGGNLPMSGVISWGRKVQESIPADFPVQRQTGEVFVGPEITVYGDNDGDWTTYHGRFVLDLTLEVNRTDSPTKQALLDWLKENINRITFSFKSITTTEDDYTSATNEYSSNIADLNPPFENLIVRTARVDYFSIEITTSELDYDEIGGAVIGLCVSADEYPPYSHDIWNDKLLDEYKFCLFETEAQSETPSQESETVSFTLSDGSDGAFVPVDIPEARSTELSANGICAVVNYSGTFYTWGDHTSAFSDGAVSDERARFDNTIRMQLMITNRFQMKYRTSVDAPMTLQMRNDVINEELDYLASLVAIGALIGEPVCEFSPLDNSADGVAQGQFVWRIADTPTIPFKYGNLKVAYTQDGLLVYIQ